VLPGEALKKTFRFWKIPEVHPPSFPIKQMTIADAEYAGKYKQTREELFLIELDQCCRGRAWLSLSSRITRQLSA
jgi:IS5 family transposase